MKSTRDILPHSNFKQIEENLWVLEGELPHHNPLPRSMTVYRMKDGGLWIHSAIALNDETQKVLESFGKPSYLVVPNSMHRLDAKIFKQTYPDIKVVCPAGARSKVEDEISVDLSCEEAFKGSSEVRALAIDGARDIELAYELALTHGSALIMTDLLVNVPKLPGLKGKLLEVMGRIGFVRTPPVQKLIFLKERPAFKQWLIEQSKKDLRIITVAHGQPVTRNVPELLKRAALQV